MLEVFKLNSKYVLEKNKMNLKKLVHKRRAVSPILAAVLLIGLAITAGAVLFIVVIPLITAPGGGLVFDESTTTLSTSSLHLILKNEGSEDAEITDVEIGADQVPGFNSFTITKGQGAIRDYNVTALTLTPGTSYTITVSWSIGGTAQTAKTLAITAD
jgi:flagellin-like protein